LPGPSRRRPSTRGAGGRLSAPSKMPRLIPGRAGELLRSRLLLLFLLLTLAGCAGAFPGSFREHPGPERVFIDSVPFYAQEEYQCGPAALAMLLTWSGREITPDQLTDQVYSPDLQGSLQPAIIAATRRHGRLAHPIAGGEALLAELAAGHPVLVLQNLGLSWFPRWHYAVVIGYDRDQNSFMLHSGAQAATSLSARVFANTWRRSGSWGLLVLAPEQIPATASEETFLAAVVGLEQASQWSAASRGYAAALARWPASFVAWMGRGNTLYLLGDPAGAEEAFRRALSLQPDNGPALNNLALALAATGRRAEALTVIRQAIELGGPLEEQFQQTLEEIGEE
jgi:tetratricopeptide (TPR) repeat protein